MTAVEGSLTPQYSEKDELLELILDTALTESGLEQLKFNQIDINHQNSRGWCLLFEASMTYSTQKLEDVLDSGVLINVRDNKGRNALFWALFAENTDNASLLIKKGINYCSNITGGITSLHYAIFKNDFEVFKILSDFMDIDTTDSQGSTPLMCAAFYDRDEMVEHLILKGADFKPVDNEGIGLLDYAISGRSLKSIETLKKLGIFDDVPYNKNSKIKDKSCQF